MNREIAMAWVDTLRNAEIVQGTGHLRRGDAYCCLGVLCNQFQAVTGAGEWVIRESGGGYVEDSHTFRFSTGVEDFYDHKTLPPLIQEWAGMTSPSGVWSDNNSLAYENDRGKTFSEIADIIEARWEEL